MKSKAEYETKGYEDMARTRTWYLSSCPYDGWQRDAWQAGAWRWMQEQRTARHA